MPDAISRLRAELDVLKQHGRTTVTIASLDAYLSSAASAPVSAQPGEVDVAMAKAGFEFQNSASLEMFKSVIEAGRTTLNALILMNGGAAVALLAFLGNSITKAPPDPRLQLRSISLAMLLFVLGVGFAGVSMGMRYLTQFLAHGRSAKAGTWMNWASIGSGLCSLALFFAGGLRAYAAFP